MLRGTEILKSNDKTPVRHFLPIRLAECILFRLMGAPLLVENLELARAALAAGQADALEPLLAQARQLSAHQEYLSWLIDLLTN